MSKTRTLRIAKTLLEKYEAPEAIGHLFEELLDINSKLPASARAKASLLFEDACRRFNFSAIHGRGDRRVQFRACLVDEQNTGHCRDTPPDAGDPFAQATEQAYRRGFVQGFTEARRMLQERATVRDIEKAEQVFQEWRTRLLQVVGSRPGSEEDLPSIEITLDFGNERQVGLGLRFNVLRRDNFKCQLCGKGAADGSTLEIDHKRSIFDGGDNSVENLWTLCFECNRGKRTSSL